MLKVQDFLVYLELPFVLTLKVQKPKAFMMVMSFAESLHLDDLSCTISTTILLYPRAKIYPSMVPADLILWCKSNPCMRVLGEDDGRGAEKT